MLKCQAVFLPRHGNQCLVASEVGHARQPYGCHHVPKLRGMNPFHHPQLMCRSRFVRMSHHIMLDVKLDGLVVLSGIDLFW